MVNYEIIALKTMILIIGENFGQGQIYPVTR